MPTATDHALRVWAQRELDAAQAAYDADPTPANVLALLRATRAWAINSGAVPLVADV